MTDCAICGETHETFVRQMADGSSHVYQDAETYRRRSVATLRHKIAVNDRFGVDSPKMRARLAELSR